MASGFTPLTIESLKTVEGVNALNNMLEKLFENLPGDTETVRDYSGYGAPTLSAGVGSTYRRLDGGANTTLYVYESGGWVAK